MRSRKLAITTAVAMAVGLLYSPSPAVASDDKKNTVKLEVIGDAVLVAWAAADAKGNPVTDVTVRSEATSNGTRFVVSSPSAPVGRFCGQVSSPAPTYSASNHWLFWGSKITCTYPESTRLRNVLWSGPTDSTITNWEMQTPRQATWSYKVDWVHPISDQQACVNWGHSIWWQHYTYAEVSWNFNNVWSPFVPYPGKSPVRYQGCAELA